jgi:alpha-L-rhamnosidase
MQSDQRGAHQTAYQIFAAPAETSLDGRTCLLWDSGKVESYQSVHVPYRGLTLTSGQRVYWKVRVWDETGREVESSSAWWKMGLLERTDWAAQWIALRFGVARTHPARPPTCAKNLHFKSNSLPPGCMQLRWGFTNVT